MGGEKDEERHSDISEILDKFGKYQIFQYILICMSTICISMISINYVFVAGDLNYRCRVDECENYKSTVEFPKWWPNSKIDRCSKPVLKSGVDVCNNNSFTDELVLCDSWIYESNDTVIAEFNLGCQPWMSNLIGTVHGLGMLISMAVFGYVSDKIGRKPTLILCVVAGCLGQLKTLATSYNTYITIEFLEGALTAGMYSAAMVLILEITSTKHRAWTGVIFSYCYHIGECLFACISYLEPRWKHLVHIINTPPIFFIIFIYLVNESPRWQIVRGKAENAKKTFRKIIATNNININNEELENMDVAKLRAKFGIASNHIKEGFSKIIKSKEIIKRVIVIFVCRFASRLLYNGMMLNSVWLPGDKHLNFILAVLVSFPGELIAVYLTIKMGRKIPLMGGYSVSGLLCIASAFCPSSYQWMKLTLFLVGKLVISICFSGIFTYGMELFPTSVRGTLLGVVAVGSRSAIMVAPLLPALSSISEGLPLILFGCVGIISGFLITLTPETKDAPLLDTIEQLEESLNHGVPQVFNTRISVI